MAADKGTKAVRIDPVDLFPAAKGLFTIRQSFLPLTFYLKARTLYLECLLKTTASSCFKGRSTC
jgi:hypothetical protein